ncbi:MAG: electron transport protein SCO1/SenC [Spartobacteria bacterium]|nr:electron transport protein SCO1/SenC [Spartobacteria bacterium]
MTPDGTISNYLFGVNFNAHELLSAITAAGHREQGSPVQRFVLLCFHYNPVTGKYAGLILNLLRASSLLTLFALFWLIVRLARNRSARLVPSN